MKSKLYEVHSYPIFSILILIPVTLKAKVKLFLCLTKYHAMRCIHYLIKHHAMKAYSDYPFLKYPHPVLFCLR